MSDRLADDVADYVSYAAIEYVTECQYLRSVRCFSEHLGRPANRADLRERLVNGWLADISTRLAAFTVLGRKRGLTPVWNWLAEQGLVPFYNRRALRRTKAAYPPVEAWSVDQVRSLLAGASDLAGTLNCGVAARDLMRSYVLIEYETGFRPSDMYRLRWDQLQGNRLMINQHKTKFPHGVLLSDGAMESLKPLRESESSKLFILKKGGIRRWELRLFAAAAQHGFTRRKRQACGTLRKTHGTEVCRVEGLPAAAESLGHKDGIRVARQSYCEADAIRAIRSPTSLINALANPSRHDSVDCQRRA